MLVLTSFKLTTHKKVLKYTITVVNCEKILVAYKIRHIIDKKCGRFNVNLKILNTKVGLKTSCFGRFV